METSQSSKTVSLAEYWDMLNAHDWYYGFSDDRAVYAKGYANLKNIVEISLSSDLHQILYIKFERHMFTGKGFGNEQQPKPPKPI